MRPLDAPKQIASGLDVEPCLQVVRKLLWEFLNGPTFDYGRMHAIVSQKRENVLALRPPFSDLLRPLCASLGVPDLVRATVLFPQGQIPEHVEPETAAVLHVALMDTGDSNLAFPSLRKTVGYDTWNVWMRTGEAWLIPSTLTHYGQNFGKTARIHLVCDFKVG